MVKKTKRLMAELDGCMCWFYVRGRFPFDGVDDGPGVFTGPWQMTETHEANCLEYDGMPEYDFDLAVMG